MGERCERCDRESCYYRDDTACRRNAVDWREQALTERRRALAAEARCVELDDEMTGVALRATLDEQAIRADERAKVVAFLRAGDKDPGGMRVTGWSRFSAHTGQRIADAIEAGEHVKEEG